MAKHKFSYPGEFINRVYLEPGNLSGREPAAKLDVSASTLNRILKRTSGISPEMALRLSKALGRRWLLPRGWRCDAVSIQGDPEFFGGWVLDACDDYGIGQTKRCSLSVPLVIF